LTWAELTFSTIAAVIDKENHQGTEAGDLIDG